MSKLIILLISISVSQLACTSSSESINSLERKNLMKFAYANCLFQYFKSKGIETTDIRNISGGVVAKSSISINLFQDISTSISNYNPDIKTKNNIDIKLNKCFYLEENADLLNIISNIANK